MLMDEDRVTQETSNKAAVKLGSSENCSEFESTQSNGGWEL